MTYRFDARGAMLPKLLGFVMVLFISILVVCYFIAKQANPIMLDEHGEVRGSHPAATR